MLCYIESTKGDVMASEGDVSVFSPPQSERDSIGQVIEITELIKAINRLNMVPDEDRVSRWMHSGLRQRSAWRSKDVFL